MIPSNTCLNFYPVNRNTPFIMRGHTGKEIIAFLFQNKINTLKPITFFLPLSHLARIIQKKKLHVSVKGETGERPLIHSVIYVYMSTTYISDI